MLQTTVDSSVCSFTSLSLLTSERSIKALGELSSTKQARIRFLFQKRSQIHVLRKGSQKPTHSRVPAHFSYKGRRNRRRNDMAIVDKIEYATFDVHILEEGQGVNEAHNSPW